MPVTPTRSLNFLARLTASWPVSASATSRISCGRAASRISAISASAARRYGCGRRCRAAPRRSPGDGRRFRRAWRSRRGPGRDDRQRVDADLAAEHGELFLRGGPLTSSDAIRTLTLLRSVRRLAILAAVVVLPAPCRPTSMIATGAGALRSIASLRRRASRSAQSWTILTTIWPGVTDLTTAAPTALVRARSMNERTTSSETSASSSARRTSRIAALTSSRRGRRGRSARPICRRAFRKGSRT